MLKDSETNEEQLLIKRGYGLVVMGGDSCFKGCEFKSQPRILD